MSFVRQGCQKLSSDRHAYITYIGYIQTDRRTDRQAFDIINDAASRVVINVRRRNGTAGKIKIY